MKQKHTRYRVVLVIGMIACFLVGWNIALASPAMKMDTVVKQAVRRTAPQPDYAQPPARINAQMVYDKARGVMVMFGGEGEGDVYLADTWEYDGVGWYEVEMDVHPAGRASHVMTYDEHRQAVVLVGGNTEHEGFYDTWEYIDQTWQLIIAEDEQVGGSSYALTLAYNAQEQQVIAITAHRNTQIWTYTGYSWQLLEYEFVYDCTCLCVYVPRAVFLEDAGQLLIESDSTYAHLLEGAQLDLAPNIIEDQAWMGRTWLVSLIYDTKYQRGLAVRGFELTEYVDGEGWEPIITEFTPDLRLYASVAYDTQRDVIVVFGGAYNSVFYDETWEFAREAWVEGAQPVKGHIPNGDNLMRDGE